LRSSRSAAARAAHRNRAKLGTKLPDGIHVGDAVAFRSLASQLGTPLAPHLLSPADTTGFSGFQFSVDLQNTSIDQRACSPARASMAAPHAA
jgi:hypothetical protein